MNAAQCLMRDQGWSAVGFSSLQRFGRCPEQQDTFAPGRSAGCCAAATERLWVQVVSSLLAGAAAGSLAGSGLADSLGRKTALLLDAVPLCSVGQPCVSATASSLTSMVMGRIFCGLGIGLALSALVPLYISEVSICWLLAAYT